MGPLNTATYPKALIYYYYCCCCIVIVREKKRFDSRGTRCSALVVAVACGYLHYCCWYWFRLCSSIFTIIEVSASFYFSFHMPCLLLLLLLVAAQGKHRPTSQLCDRYKTKFALIAPQERCPCSSSVTMWCMYASTPCSFLFSVRSGQEPVGFYFPFFYCLESVITTDVECCHVLLTPHVPPLGSQKCGLKLCEVVNAQICSKSEIC